MAGRTIRRFQSASVLTALLLALAGIVAASASLKSVAKGGPLMSRSLQDICTDELYACVDDTSCVDCVTDFSTIEGCETSTGSSCDDMQELACCALAGEAEECYTNAIFTNYVGG